MKNLFKYTFMALVGMILAVSCTDEYEYDGVGEAENPAAAGVYFNEKKATKSLEVEPGAEEFDLTLARTNTESAQTVSIVVVSDEAGVFDVPSAVRFAAGESTTTLHITAPRAEEGGEYTLTVGIADDERAIYGVGVQSYTVNLSVQKWEDVGTCYWVDGIVSQWYNVNPSYAYAVEVQKLVQENGIRFRFVGPYSHACTGQDELGAYIGYPFNAGKGDEEDHMFIIDVTSDGAYLNPVSMGINWGYGTMSTGSIFGNLSTNKAAFPLGTYDERAGVITFPLNSLYIADDDGPAQCKKNPTYLYLSAEAYLNSLEE